MERKKNLIVGIGNTLMTDDGIGVYLVRELENRAENKKDNRFLDLGTSSPDIGYYINEDIEKLVFIDCIKSENHEPGTVFKLTLDDFQKEKKNDFSLHQLGLIDSLKLCSINSELPETIIIGVVPHSINTYSTNLSNSIKSKFSSIFTKVQNEVSNFLSE